MLRDQQCNNIFETDLIKSLQTPVISFVDLSPQNNTGSDQVRKQLEASPEIIRKIEEFIRSNTPVLTELWEKEIKRITEDNAVANSAIESQLAKIIPEFEILKQKVEQNEQLKKLMHQIAEEKSKLQTANERESKEQELIEKIDEIRIAIDRSHEKYHQVYTEYCSIVNAIGISKSTDLSFSARTEWKKNAFSEFISDAFDNRYFISFNSTYNHTITNPSEAEYSSNLLMDIWNALSSPSKVGGLHIKGSYSLKTALQRLFDDWYNIHYIVTSGNDTISDMSPGKKALALLELLISLKDTHCPILIDQPEDDLDNRSIYNELVRFIKNKKCERQIIVVTHNANVVLGADAEQVIIANQSGKDTPNNCGLRFEYRSGAIEDNESELNTDGTKRDGILSGKGIQTQICDILEGGRPALELRRNKYTSNNQTEI